MSAQYDRIEMAISVMVGLAILGVPTMVSHSAPPPADGLIAFGGGHAEPDGHSLEDSPRDLGRAQEAHLLHALPVEAEDTHVTVICAAPSWGSNACMFSASWMRPAGMYL